MSQPSAKKVLLIAWDATEWNLVQPLLDTGQLPHLARLIDAGVLAKLSTLSPMISTPLLTSIATGRRPEQHGVCADREPGADGLAPVSARWRRGSTLWEIAARHGWLSLAVDWPTSLPCADTAGLAIACGDSATPARLATDVAELRVKPAELSRDDLRPFVPDVDQLEPSAHPLLAALMRHLADAAGTQTVATFLLENEPWDFAAVNFGALGRIFRTFIDYTAPRLPQISETEFARYSRVVAQALVLHDTMLGRLIELAGANAAVLLCSTHGWMTGARRPALEPDEHARHVSRERPQGWAVLRAPGVRADELIFGGNVLDVAPTLLWLMGLPVPQDWPGKVWYHATTQPAPAASVSTHEPAVLAPPELPVAFDEPTAEFRYAYGSYLLGAARAADAIPHLEEVRRALPTRVGPALQLINAYVIERRFAEATARLEELAARPEGGLRPQPGQRAKFFPQYDFVRGVIAHGEGRFADALRHFESVLAGGAQTAELHGALGRAYLALRRVAEAQAAFRRALAIEPDDAAAHYGLALACYRRREFSAAAEHALDASMRRTEPPEFHLLLGMATARVGEREHAIVALRHALARQPALLLAHRALVALHRKNPAESALAEAHRRAARDLRGQRLAK